MTSPVPRGYGDYERLYPISDQILVNANATLTSEDAYGPFYVGNLQALRMLLTPTAHDVALEIDIYSDLAGTNRIGFHLLSVATNQAFQRTIRPWGPVMTWRVQTIGGLATPYQFILATVADTNAPLQSPIGMFQHEVLDQVLLPGETFTTPFRRATYGPIYWLCYCSAASWEARLEMIDVTSSALRFGRANDTLPLQRGILLAPGGACQFTITNNDAVNQTFTNIIISGSNEGSTF